MKILKPMITALILATLSCHMQAAPGNWGASKSTPMAEVKEKIEANEYQSAIDKLLQIVTRDEGNADAYNLLGYSNRKLKRFDIAEQFYLKALELNPKHKGALEYLGELYVETNQLDMANQMLQRLDQVCRFKCKEYKQLAGYIESGKASVSGTWK